MKVTLVLFIRLTITLYLDLKRGGTVRQLNRQIAKLCNTIEYLERSNVKTMTVGMLDNEKRSREHQTNLKMPAAKRKVGEVQQYNCNEIERSPIDNLNIVR